MALAVAGLVSRSEAADEKFEEKILYKMGPLAPSIHREYRRIKRRDRRRGNIWLRKIGEHYDDAPVYLRKLKDLQSIEDKAKALARKCIGDVPRVRNYLESQDLQMPIGDDDAAKLARASEWHYWNPKLKRDAARFRDNLARKAGIVHKRKQVYCSDLTLEWQQECQRRTEDSLWKTTMTPDDPEIAEFQLYDFWEHSLANPEVRRPEIMTRLRGLEDFAEWENEYDDADVGAVFVTMTLPSKHHARHYLSGDANEKYDGSSVRDGTRELRYTWSLFRSYCSYHSKTDPIRQDGIPMYGIRIAEPHHDGTPHWHFLLWIERAQRQTFMRAFRRYAMRVDGDEPGARKHRIKFEWIDKAKGSATAYVAKYIAKSIDGHNVGKDRYGNSAVKTAARIVAWARTHGTRQFQQIGGPFVGPWRELRLLATMPVPPHHVTWAYASSPGDLKPDWCGYMRAMGGGTPGRNQPTKIVRGIRTSKFTGETTPAKNCYGEVIEGSKLPVIGLVREDMFIETRFTMWTARFTGVRNEVPYPADSGGRQKKRSPMGAVATDTKNVRAHQIRGQGAVVDIRPLLNARSDRHQPRGAVFHAESHSGRRNHGRQDAGRMAADAKTEREPSRRFSISSFPNGVAVGPRTRDNNCTRAPPMNEKNDPPTVNPFLEDLKILEGRIEEAVNDETPGAKARTEKLFAEMLGWMKMAAELIPS